MRKTFQHTFNFYFSTLLILLISFGSIAQTKIDRLALVSRHNVQLNALDTLASLTVGNGAFAYTVDVTGLQTFPEVYQKGIPLGTQSEWGWDRYPNEKNFKFEESLQDYSQYGRKVSYSDQREHSDRTIEAVNWFRANPHRVHLGNLGFELYMENGLLAGSDDIENIEQELNLWTGIIQSNFTIEGIPVTVWTAADQEADVIGVRVESALIEKDRLKVRLRIPYPSNTWKDVGTEWVGEKDYESTLQKNNANDASVIHKMDSLTYQIGFAWEGNAEIEEKDDHYFVLNPSEKSSFEFSVKFTNENLHRIPQTSSVFESSEQGWKKFWESGGAIDFSGSTDPRAFELERRVVLSQYLTNVQATGTIPPQETGLTYNSWYGRPHLEMHWWHGVHFPLWGRPVLLERSLPWYNEVYDKAEAIARRQGFEGVRWQKMTDPKGNESPSSVGSFLIWQQPHIISFAELMYRSNPTNTTLELYKERVFATADFMASFAHYQQGENRYILGPPLIPAQERFKAEETYNPSYELAYWKWGLTTALEWKKRLHEKPSKEWEKVLNYLSPLPVQNEVYLATESATDSYTNPVYKTDHPSVLGVFGMLPETSSLDKQIMKNTFELVWETWSWEDTWGWDFPMTAMTAARLGMPEKAVDALFMDVPTNTYLKNGHNYQDERLTLYLPGNGGLLTAVAMMSAGWDGSTGINPGFPNDGTWNITWEGLEKMF